MELLLPLPSKSNYFEGFRKDGRLQRNCIHRRARLAQSSLVSFVDITDEGVSSLSRPPSVTEPFWCNSKILCHQPCGLSKGGLSTQVLHKLGRDTGPSNTEYLQETIPDWLEGLYRFSEEEYPGQDDGRNCTQLH